MNLVIIKIGGSCLSYKKEGIPKIRKGFLKRFSNEVSHYIKNDKNTLIIIHGGGSITHPLLDSYNIAKKLKAGIINTQKEKRASAHIHLAMSLLNKKVVGTLLKKGIPSWPIQTSAVFTAKNRGRYDFNFNPIKLALSKGFVPIIHGDFIFDSITGISICSGDLIACALAKHLKATKLLFASDVDGVYSQDPYVEKNASLFSKLTKSELRLKVKRGKSIDHSGDMAGKLDYIGQYCKNTKTIIFNGLKKDNIKRILEGEKLGTEIIIN